MWTIVLTDLLCLIIGYEVGKFLTKKKFKKLERQASWGNPTD